MLYDGSRCTYCGRCADVCPEGAITMSADFETASDHREDLTTRLELFMLTCQRCGRCYEMENRNVLDRLDLAGYRYDNLEARAMIRKTSAQWSEDLLRDSENYSRPTGSDGPGRGGAEPA